MVLADGSCRDMGVDYLTKSTSVRLLAEMHMFIRGMLDIDRRELEHRNMKQPARVRTTTCAKTAWVTGALTPSLAPTGLLQNGRVARETFRSIQVEQQH